MKNFKTNADDMNGMASL